MSLRSGMEVSLYFSSSYSIIFYLCYASNDKGSSYSNSEAFSTCVGVLSWVLSQECESSLC